MASTLPALIHPDKLPIINAIRPPTVQRGIGTESGFPTQQAGFSGALAPGTAPPAGRPPTTATNANRLVIQILQHKYRTYRAALGRSF